ncbi:MAG: Sua5/YciO/YrdC/YwlC family protein [Mariprofundaceae bacterium]|nr:Sua5/YciO/YrdC/YwlC family protein [Mariprofundaceae bacterium]
MPPKPSRRTSRKLNQLRLVPLLKRGGLVAHHTATLPGVACLPFHRQGISRMQHFKQRKGPFLLLADSRRTARSLIRWYPAGLRAGIKSAWPGQITIIVSARPGLSADCYRHGRLAIRVDADAACRRLAQACGGLLVSSSLNRKGGRIHRPSRDVHMRWHRFLAGRAAPGESCGHASEIWQVGRRGMSKIR